MKVEFTVVSCEETKWGFRVTGRMEAGFAYFFSKKEIKLGIKLTLRLRLSVVDGFVRARLTEVGS